MSTVHDPHNIPPADDPRSLGTLLKEIRDESTTLFRQEVALAKTEISEKASRAMRHVAMLAVGALVAFAGLIVLLIAAGHGVSHMLIAMDVSENVAIWLGPLLVGAIVAAIGGAMAMANKKSLEHESLVPEKTAQSMKENKQWLKRKATA